MKKSNTVLIIIISAVILLTILGITVGYFYFQRHSENNQNPSGRGNFPFNESGRMPRNFSSNGSREPPQNFQLNESQISETMSFFSGGASLDEMRSYCTDNRVNCMYYCRNVGFNSSICGEMMNDTRGRGGQGWNQ
jgi:hypothetical protein